MGHALQAGDVPARLAAFAKSHIAPSLGTDGAPLAAFPTDAWQALAAEGLLALGLPEEHGGLGGDWALVGRCGQALAAHGGDLGFAMSWQLHTLLARLMIGRLGTPEQKARLLPDMAAGRLTLAMGISEPGVGAHPKRLRAKAERVAAGWRISGEKTFLTNGPIAGQFIVVAGTGTQNGRTAFSAFLVPKETAGLTRVEMQPLGFLLSSPHCGLKLDGCVVPGDALIGQEGRAFEELSLPMRHVEDTLGSTLSAGAMRHLLGRLAAAARALDPVPDDLAERLGALAGVLAGLDCLADASVAALDRDIAEDPTAAARAVGFRTLAKHFQAQAAAFAAEFIPVSDAMTAGLMRDIDKTLDIAKSARLVKQSRLGLSILSSGILNSGG